MPGEHGPASQLLLGKSGSPLEGATRPCSRRRLPFQPERVGRRPMVSAPQCRGSARRQDAWRRVRLFSRPDARREPGMAQRLNSLATATTGRNTAVGSRGLGSPRIIVKINRIYGISIPIALRSAKQPAGLIAVRIGNAFFPQPLQPGQFVPLATSAKRRVRMPPAGAKQSLVVHATPKVRVKGPEADNCFDQQRRKALCHGRAWPKYPRLLLPPAAKSWVAGPSPSPAMTQGALTRPN